MGSASPLPPPASRHGPHFTGWPTCGADRTAVPDTTVLQPLDESSAAGRGFLPETCVAWEEATRPAEMAGIRVVHLRIGLVLAGAGGVLAKLRTPFSLGLGGPVGSGRQGMSWISLDDLIGAVMHCLRPAKSARAGHEPRPASSVQQESPHGPQSTRS